MKSDSKCCDPKQTRRANNSRRFFAVTESLLKSLFPDKNLNPEKIRMSYWLNDKKTPVEKVMDLSGQKWVSSLMMYKKINVDEQRELINKFHPLR